MSLTKTNFKIRKAKGALPINTSYHKPKARPLTKMRFWVELKDHVPNGQTVTSLLRFKTFNTKQTLSESMSGGKGVAAVTSLIPVTNTQLNTVRVLLSVFAARDKSDKSSRAINTAAIHEEKFNILLGEEHRELHRFKNHLKTFTGLKDIARISHI